MPMGEVCIASPYQSVFAPCNTLGFVRIGVGETLYLTGLTSKQAV